MNFYKDNKLLRLIILFLFTILCIGNLFGESPYEGFEEKGDFLYFRGTMVTCLSLQKNCDIMRLRHLEYYGRLIEEYHEKTGKYPFQSKSTPKLPVYIYVANRGQKKFAKMWDKTAVLKHKSLPFKDLVVELERVLGREIDEYYDPQIHATIRWNIYIYAVYDDTYYFAVHVFQEFPFSKHLGAYANKVEISNVSHGGKDTVYKASTLFEDPIFRAVVDKKIEKEDYFSQREEKYLHDTKGKKSGWKNFKSGVSSFLRSWNLIN